MSFSGFASDLPLAIKGKINGAANGQKVYLSYADISSETIDSTVISDGQFSFTTKLSSPRILSVILRDSQNFYNSKGLNFVATEGIVQIDGNFNDLKDLYELRGTGSLADGVNDQRFPVA